MYSMKGVSKILLTALIILIVIIAIFAIFLIIQSFHLPAQMHTSPTISSPTNLTTISTLPECIIKIGFFAPITGPASADGMAAKNGAELAIKHINEAGGIKLQGRTCRVELIVYDDQLSTDQAVAIAHKLIQQDKVVGVVSGSYSGPTLAVSSIFDENKVPLVVSYAVNPLITANKTYVFRVGMLGETEGKAAAYVAIKYFNAKRIAILYVDNPFGRSLAESAKKYAELHNSTIVYYEKFSDDTRDFSTWLSVIRGLNPDVLLFFGYYYHATGVKQAKEMGINIPIIGTEGFDSPKFPELAGAAAEGVLIVTDLNRDSPSELVKKFLKEYKEKTGMPADMVAASAYDAVRILARAIEIAQSISGQDIVKALEKINNFEGVTGIIIRFTPGHNAVKYLTVQVIKEGEFRYYTDITEPEIITPST